MQLASLVAFKITRPPRYPPHLYPPPPHFLPPPSCLTPTTLHAYHISYKGPNKYPQPLCALLTITTATLPQKQDTNHCNPEKPNTSTIGTNVSLPMAYVCIHKVKGVIRAIKKFARLIMTSWSINHTLWVSLNLQGPHHFSRNGSVNRSHQHYWFHPSLLTYLRHSFGEK